MQHALTNEEDKAATDFVKAKMIEAENRKIAQKEKFAEITDRITKATDNYNKAVQEKNHMGILKHQGEMHKAMDARFSFLYD